MFEQGALEFDGAGDFCLSTIFRKSSIRVKRALQMVTDFASSSSLARISARILSRPSLGGDGGTGFSSDLEGSGVVAVAGPRSGLLW